jgi:hypothetical protein
VEAEGLKGQAPWAHGVVSMMLRNQLSGLWGPARLSSGPQLLRTELALGSHNVDTPDSVWPYVDKVQANTGLLPFATEANCM